MPNVNIVILAGHLTRDPELRYTPNNIAVCDFTLGVNSGYGDKKEAAFVAITCWQKTAENVAQYLRKGSACLVEGRITQDNWEGKDGKKQTKTKVTASRVQFLGGKPEPATQNEPAGPAFMKDEIPF